MNDEKIAADYKVCPIVQCIFWTWKQISNFNLNLLVILHRTQVQGGSVLHLVLALRGGN